MVRGKVNERVEHRTNVLSIDTKARLKELNDRLSTMEQFEYVIDLLKEERLGTKIYSKAVTILFKVRSQ